MLKDIFKIIWNLNKNVVTHLIRFRPFDNKMVETRLTYKGMQKEFERVNRNNRRYTSDGFDKAINDYVSKMSDINNQGITYGEIFHPIKDKPVPPVKTQPRPIQE